MTHATPQTGSAAARPHPAGPALHALLARLPAREVDAFGVDSGQFVVVDSAGIDAFRHEPFNDVRPYRTVDGLQLSYPTDFARYDRQLDALGGQSPNDAIAAGRMTPVRDADPNDSFSYDGACRTSLAYPAGLLRNPAGRPVAAAAPTAFGDGVYGVYALGGTDAAPDALWVVTVGDLHPASAGALLQVGDLELGAPIVIDPAYLQGGDSGLSPVAALRGVAPATWRVVAALPEPLETHGPQRPAGLLLLRKRAELALPPLDAMPRLEDD